MFGTGDYQDVEILMAEKEQSTHILCMCVCTRVSKLSTVPLSTSQLTLLFNISPAVFALKRTE